MEKLPMTVAGYAALEAELKRRQQEDRPRIIQAIAEARSHGDLSENAEYHAAKESQSHNEGRIAELEDKLSRADVIDVGKLSGNTVKFGATVTLIDEDTEAEKRYQIVGDMEADVKSGKISVSSPISRALIGKKVGDIGRSQHARRRQELRNHEDRLHLRDFCARRAKSPCIVRGLSRFRLQLAHRPARRREPRRAGAGHRVVIHALFHCHGPAKGDNAAGAKAGSASGG